MSGLVARPRACARSRWNGFGGRRVWEPSRSSGSSGFPFASRRVRPLEDGSWFVHTWRVRAREKASEGGIPAQVRGDFFASKKKKRIDARIKTRRERERDAKEGALLRWERVVVARYTWCVAQCRRGGKKSQ